MSEPKISNMCPSCLYAAPLFRKKEPELDSYQQKTPKSRWLVSTKTASFEVVVKN